MSVPELAGDSVAGRVIALLSAWPTVRAARADCGVGVGVAVGANARQFLHFHDESYADLRLTHAVIDRMHDALADSGRVLMVPGDDWIGVPLETASDAHLLVTLVSVAIKANSVAHPFAAARPLMPCGADRVRVTVAG